MLAFRLYREAIEGLPTAKFTQPEVFLLPIRRSQP